MSTTSDLTAAFSGLDAQITRVFDVMMGKTPVLNGPPGATGPLGPTGPLAATGPTGATGLTGAAGVTGLGLGTTIKGVWSSGTTYGLNGGTNPDSVTYNGSLFVCTTATGPSAFPPDVDTAHWLLIVAQGATGSVSSVGTDGQFLYNNAGIVAGANFFLYRATGPTGPTGGATGPRAPTVQVAAYVVPTTDGTYDLGATGIQFKDVHFSGSIYNNGIPFQGGVSGLVYRATGPTGPTGGATGPRAPTLQTTAHILPTADLTYDLGATGLRFRDIYVGGTSIHMGNSTVISATGLNLNVTTPAGTNSLVSAVYGPSPAQLAAVFLPAGASESPYIQDNGGGAITGIASSADGLYVSAIRLDGGAAPAISVHTPSDAAGVFTNKKYVSAPNNQAFNAIAMSASGQYQIAVQAFRASKGGGVYVSGDYGATWVNKWVGTGLNFIAAAVTNSHMWFAATASGFYYTSQAAGSISTWNAVTDFVNDGQSYVNITQIQVSNDGQYLLVLESGYGGIGVLYSLSTGTPVQVGTDKIYDFSKITNVIISNLTSMGFAVACFSDSFGTSSPTVIQYTLTPNTSPSGVAISDGSITTPLQIVTSSDCTYQIAVFNTNQANKTSSYISYDCGTTWTSIFSSDPYLNQLKFIQLSQGANYTYAVSYEGGTIVQSLRICNAPDVYTQNTTLPYTPANSSIWPSLNKPTTLKAGIDTLAANTLSAFSYSTKGGSGSLNLTANIVPYTDAIYNLGTTRSQFNDINFSGTLYNNGVPFSGGGTYPNGSYKDPLTNVTVTGPILSMGATGSAGPIILQAGLSATHVLEKYTATGPNWAYSQTKTQPGSYNLNTIYGPSGPDLGKNSLTYLPQIIFNTSRGYATGPTGLQSGDIMGAVIFKEQGDLRGFIYADKIAEPDHASLNLHVGGGDPIISIRSTGPDDSIVGPNMRIIGQVYPRDTNFVNLGATGYQFKDIHFAGTLYNNGVPFSGGGGGGGGTTGLTYRATGPTGPTGGPTGPAPQPTIQIGTHLVPDKDLTYDLGATGLRFRDMYVGGSTIYLGDTVTLSGSAGTLSVNSAPLVSSTTVPNTGAGGIGVTFSKILEYPDISGIIQTTPGTISMSANGQYISYITGDRTGTTGYIYVSSNYGASFANSPSDGYSTNTATNAAHGIIMNDLYFSAIAVSSTGQYQTALEYNGGIFCSSDYGQTWRETFAYTYTGGNWVVSNTTGFGYNRWGGVCISSDGKIQVVWNIAVYSSTSDPTMYISNNKIPTTSTDWLQNSTFDVGSNSDIILQCCMSASGDRIIALSGAYTSSYVTTYYITRSIGNVAVSQINLNGTGYGRRFDSITINSTPYLFSNISIQLSSDGSRIGIFARYVNGSDNLGASIGCSWGSATSPFSIIGVNTIMSAYFGSPLKLSMSSDGAVQVVSFGLTNGIQGMYISYNYGVTWSTILNLAAKYVEFNFTSANGSYINAFNFSVTNRINQCSSFYQCHSTSPTLTLTNIPYTPTTSGDWPTALVPTTVGGALDTIAKYLKIAGSSTWANLT